MNIAELPGWYVSGPHPDYYLLLDEEAELIFADRLAAHVREARREHADLAQDSLFEIWIDDATKDVWYVFEAQPTKGRA